MGSLLNDVNILISKRVGDLSRLEHIKETIENNKQLYDSDRNYVDGLIKNHLLSNENKTVENTSQKNDESENISKDNAKNETKIQETFCGNCGDLMNKDNDFCPKCGTGKKLQNESFCPKCGNKIFGNNSCSNCNTQYRANTNPTRQRPVEWKSEGTTLILTIVLGIFGLGGIGHIYLGNITRGIVILIVGIILLVFSIFTFGIGLIILIPFAIWVVFDSRSQCRSYNDYLEKNGKSPWQ